MSTHLITAFADRRPNLRLIHRRQQHGVMLLEALIAILVFSLGVLALVGLQSVALREVTVSKMRTDASYVADKVLGDLSTTALTGASLAGFAGVYSPGNRPAGADAAISNSWETLLAQRLPNGTITLTTALGGAATDPTAITVQIDWQTATGPQRFVQIARLSDS